MPRLKQMKGLRRLLHARLQPELAPHQTSSALIIAPHQDDETLGCGGTIALKRNAGTQVTVAFMTDGTTSHQRYMSEAELKARRHSEAVDACEILGVSGSDVRFLDFPDGKLGSHCQEGLVQVVRILNLCRPAEVFVPYQHDGTPDHEATYQIVRGAVQEAGHVARIYEYPIWIWNRWPWVQLRPAATRECIGAVANACLSGFGLNGLRTFRCGVRIDGVLDQKRQALHRHRTQMTAVIAGVPWPTLSDVSDGDFLQCFFQDFEVFRCTPHYSLTRIGTGGREWSDNLSAPFIRPRN
jgi:LmbE family N-acetylglucosaminyl deacetylase